MLVVPEKRALVLSLADPGRVTTVIPTAKHFTMKGKQLVAVPHRLDEVRVLRNLGFDAPSPIRYHYEWSGRYAPFEAQQVTAEFLTLNRRAYVLNDLGTGKSLASLWAYDYLRSIGVHQRVLVVSPLSTLERTWADEVFQHFPHLNYAVLHGSKTRRLKLLDQEADVYIVNHDGVEIIAGALEKRDDITLIIPDEISQAARNQRTDRWRALNTVINKQQDGSRWAWGLTGTPIPNSPADAWAQCRLLTPDTVPRYFGRFREMVMRQVSIHSWVPRDNAHEIVGEAMQPAVRFSRDECVDLPPVMYETRQVEMTAAQSSAYKQMLLTMKTEAEEGQIIAVNEAVKMSKLVQIACGVVYDSTGEEVTIPATHRVKAVIEVVQQAKGKVIVFVPFVSSVQYVADALRKEFGNELEVGVIHGGVAKADRDSIFSDFQRGMSSLRVLVAQPAAMSHGLTLTEANTILWYAPVTSNEVFEQANGRITRPGQKLDQFIIMLEGTPVEQKIYARLRTKQSMQGLLLDEVRRERSD